MRDSLVAGLRKVRRIIVDETRAIGFLGEGARTYATPSLVRDVELTCRELILEHVGDGEDSVGTRVEIEHLAPTPMGAWAEVTATVTEIDRRRVAFDFEVRDAVEPIAKGRHSRFVVDKTRVLERIAAKKAKLAEAG